MIAYLLAPLCAFISAIVFIVPSEVLILMLANMHKVAFEVKGYTIDLSPYGTDFPWLLPVVASAGGVVGSYFYYFMGNGTMKISTKVQQKIDNFDMTKLTNVGIVALLTANIASFPPVSLTSFASGAIKLDHAKFITASFIGRSIRYYIVILLGQFAIEKALKFIG